MMKVSEEKRAARNEMIRTALRQCEQDGLDTVREICADFDDWTDIPYTLSFTDLESLLAEVKAARAEIQSFTREGLTNPF